MKAAAFFEGAARARAEIAARWDVLHADVYGWLE